MPIPDSHDAASRMTRGRSTSVPGAPPHCAHGDDEHANDHARNEGHDTGRECGPDRRGRATDSPVKVVERTWFFSCEEQCDHSSHCECRRRVDGGSVPSHWPGRPSRPGGKDSGRLSAGGPMTPGDINHPNPPGVFVGGRTQLDLPYLFLRANPADLGKRPVVSAPFWESPDIFILAGVHPALAPDVPPSLGQEAQSGEVNTIYAHLWNFGNAAANEVVVEFYWVNPSLGISSDSVNLIAQTFTSLGAKGSGRSHAVVKCPKPWVPTYVNGGHECLLVRVWDNPADLPGEPTFDASWNRHIGQRNIHVVPPPGLQAKKFGPGISAALEKPVLIRVGPLFGAPATVDVQRVSPNSVPWLQLRSGKRGVFPAMAPPTGVPTLSPPTTGAVGFPTSAAGATTQVVHGDDKHVAFSTTDASPAAGEAHVYRVSASQAGTLFGGYTIVVLG
jgi:hypothetical protein